MIAGATAGHEGLGLVLLKGGEPARVGRPRTDEEAKKRPGRRRIRCPACGWEPDRHDVWMCTCLHSWNTFDTGGVCPACGRRWSETQCPRCGAWSRHEDWYEDEGDHSRAGQ